MKKLGHFIFSKLGLLSFYSLKKSGYLHDKGWFASFKSKRCVDKNGNPIPWMTYSFVDFLEPRLSSNFEVFEYGCGNSTIWWGQKVSAVTACEHNEQWMKEVEPTLPETAQIILKDVNDFAKAVNETSTKYDIIVIDGEDRVECARQSITALKEGGVILWDNSDRTEYQEGYDHLIAQGFKRLDFYGLGPINVMAWSTSVFYKDGNCLGI